MIREISEKDISPFFQKYMMSWKYSCREMPEAVFDHSSQIHTLGYIIKFSIQTILEFMLLWHIFPQASSISIEFSMCLCWNPLKSVFKIYQMSLFSSWPIKQSQLSYKIPNSNFIETEIKALP